MRNDPYCWIAASCSSTPRTSLQRGPLVQHAGQFGEFVYGADGVDFDAPVVEIAGVAGEAEIDGGALREVAIADALHAAADEPSLGVNWLAG